jgi:hypothetical protein
MMAIFMRASPAMGETEEHHHACAHRDGKQDRVVAPRAGLITRLPGRA